MQKVRIILFIALLFAFMVDNVFATDPFGIGKIIDHLKGDTNTVDITIQRYIANILQFLYIIATIYGIYGGFLILTAGEDKEERIKKGKTIIIQALIGIVVIFLANSIVTLILGGSGTTGILSDGSSTGTTIP